MPKANNSAHAEKRQPKGFFERLEEWNAIEDLVMTYKRQFEPDCSASDKLAAKNAAAEIMKTFEPLFTKYTLIIKTGHIDFDDKESKRFVRLFIGDARLKNALKGENVSHSHRYEIKQKFNFVRETYGSQDENIIRSDLQLLMLILAKRYRQMGYNFCAYVYNAYSFEVSRHIYKFISNPANIPYRAGEYEDYMQTYEEQVVEDGLVDKTYENNVGVPDSSWVQGTTCSDLFSALDPVERKILIKYYMEEMNDRQIGEALGLHINTINKKRRKALATLAEVLDVSEEDIKRSRNSGKNTLFALD